MNEITELNISREKARAVTNYHSSQYEYSRYTHHVHHKDGNPLNNDPENLEILTIKEHRQKHMKNKDRTPKPVRVAKVFVKIERPIRIIISKEDWIEIKVKMLCNRVTFQSIGNQFGISRQRIHQIIKHGYPARPRAKQILDYFYGRLS